MKMVKGRTTGVTKKPGKLEINVSATASLSKEPTNIFNAISRQDVGMPILKGS